MMFFPHILLPGPTPVPESVQRAMMTSMSDHRGHLFDAVRNRVTTNLHALFHLDPQGRVAVLPASGTGGLEAVVQNFFQPGDQVIVVEGGLFGQRFGRSAESVGLNVTRINHPWGTPFDPSEILQAVKNNPEVKGVLVTHNETSTGVLNPIKDLGTQLSAIPNRPLLIVDSISGAPSVPLPMPDWGVDVAVAASQKGFMVPPGLAIVAATSRALPFLQSDRPGRYFLDLTPYFENNFPYTPAVSLWYGLEEALVLLAQEGETARLERHQLLSRITRAFVRGAGLTLSVEDANASPTVTAIHLPEDIAPARLRKACAADNLQIAGGLGPWSSNGFRIGHVGALDVGDLWAGLGILARHVPRPSDAIAAAFSTWQTAR